MPKRRDEIAYIETRLAVTLRQAECASDECGRSSHEALADLYRARLARLGKNAAPSAAFV